MKILPHDMPDSAWRAKAKRNGISAKNYRTRITRGWSKQDAATKPLQHPCNRKPDPSSRRSKAKAAGVRTETIRNYIKRNPGTTLTDDEIIAAVVSNKRRQTVAHLARQAGKKPATVYKRLALGWSLDDALSKARMTNQESGRSRARQVKEQKRSGE